MNPRFPPELAWVSLLYRGHKPCGPWGRQAYGFDEYTCKLCGCKFIIDQLGGVYIRQPDGLQLYPKNEERYLTCGEFT